MAREDDDWKRRREREDEREREEAEEALKKRISGKAGSEPQIGKADPLQTHSASLDTTLEKVQSMIDQVDHLYGMYFSGVDKLPPIQVRSVLEQLMVSLQNQQKSTPAQKFKYSNLVSRFQAYRDRWDKKLKDLEKGRR
jgi:hypothetical protein